MCAHCSLYMRTWTKIFEIFQDLQLHLEPCTCTWKSCWSSMAFSYQLNRLTEEELAKDAKEEFGETKNLLEVILMSLSSWTFLFLFSDFHERPEDMDVKISPSSLNSTGWCGPLLEPRHKKKIFQVLKTFLRGCKFSMERTKVSDKTIDILCLGWLFF